MSMIHEVPIEPLSDQTFASFGQIVSAKDREADFQTESGTKGWAVDFQSGRPLVMLLQTPYQKLQVSKLECHFAVTQTFLPLGGSPAVLAVAPPSRDGAVPAPTEVRAFLLDGSKGYALFRGTWHSLDRLPLYPPETRWVIITDHETQRDLPSTSGGQASQLTREVDYRARFGVTFALTLGR
jgi:ureidoglycolate hydrolase